MSFDNSRDAGNCLSSSHVASAGNTVTLLAAGPTNLYGFMLENNHTADVFIQFFNKATAGAVTLGTTTADLTVRLPASGAVVYDPFRAFKHFPLGIVYAVTSTRTGLTAPGANATITLSFSKR